jgi:hypothetical protein
VQEIKNSDFLNAEDGGSNLLWNISNSLAHDTVFYVRRLESS